MTGQFRKFIKGYADLARPLNQVAAEASKPDWKVGMAWGHEQQTAFVALKEAIPREVT